MGQLWFGRRSSGVFALTALLLGCSIYTAYASDHLDTPTVIADPAADIADLYAWMAPDGKRLNLVMTIVAHRFSDRLQYVFHVGSGDRFGETKVNASLLCRFDAANTAECWVGDADYVRGDASGPQGIAGQNGRFRVFAGLRDDPFFNNVRGTRAALNAAKAALQHGTSVDAAGYPLFDAATVHAIVDHWRHTDGGPGTNFLAGWKTAALVVTVDLDVVATGGKQLAVWSGVYKP